MQQWLIQIIFFVFALLAVSSALMVITLNNSVRCALFLVVTFFASAVLWILLEAEFLALILVLVYVGAVMTLFLFVVMMLNIDMESMRKHFIRYLPLGLLFIAGLISLLVMVLPRSGYESTLERVAVGPTVNYMPAIKPIPNTAAIGNVLYTDYVLAFEMAAALLLVAIIAAVSLVHRSARRSKQQNVRKQLMTTKADRLTLVQVKLNKQEE